MPFPSKTMYDDYQKAIDWLLNILDDAARYPILKAKARPKLVDAVADNFESWVRYAPSEEIPSIVLGVHRWLERGSDPKQFLDRIEGALTFNVGNAHELGNLTGNIFHPIKSSDSVIQCLITKSLQQRAGARLHPVATARPDIDVRLTTRNVGIEVTSRNPTAADRARFARGGVIVGTIDPDAKDDFTSLWNKSVLHKLSQYNGTAPIVLVIWDCTINDLHATLTEGLPLQKTFQQILDAQRPDCTPLAALVLLPYTSTPQIVICGALSRGQPLTSDEVAELKRLFEVNPAVEQGFWPREEIPKDDRI